MNDDVRPIGRVDADRVATTLARAFATDPVFVWTARGRAGGLDRRLVHGFRAVLAGELRRDDPQLFMSADGRSASIWHGVDEWRGSNLDTVRSLPAFVRSFGLGIGRVMTAISAIEKAHPPAPHLHLAFVGTDPDHRGRGLGASVLAPMLQRCDDDGIPAYLENSNPRNESFYLGLGFTATGHIDMPAGAPPVTAMWREPR